MPDSDARDARLRSPLDYEERFWSRGRLRVAGVDEVGRGPLAGPVVACAVVLPRGVHIEGATDSKRLTAPERERLSSKIRASGAAIGIGEASPAEIDARNILNATALAMRRALDQVAPVDQLVVDGLPMKALGREHDAVVGGDLHVHSIACASIVAKVYRDDLMRRLAEEHPEYGWESNAGYGTRHHRDAIAHYGETPHHRRTFLGLQYDLF